MKSTKKELIIKKLFAVLSMLFLLMIYSYADESFILSSEDGEGALIYPRQVKEGPDGNIYAYDRKDAFIKVYSPKGKFLRKIGGKGEGPGEIKRIDGVNFGFTTDNNLFFTEYFVGHPWITLMKLDGRFHKILKLNTSKKIFGVENAVSLHDGGFLIEFAFMGKAEKRKNKYFLQSSYQGLFRIDAEGRIVSKIKEANYFTRISFYSRGADLGIPFTPIFKWRPYKNDTIIFSDGMDNKLKVLSYNGELISEIVTSIPENEEVTKKDLENWKTRLKKSFGRNQREIDWFKKYGIVIENYKESIYDKKPYIMALAVTPGENILITGHRDKQKIDREFWLIDERGKTLAKISLAAYALHICKHFIILKRIDSEDNEVVVCFKRSGDEKHDILSLGK
jgi:hypothetical protein